MTARSQAWRHLRLLYAPPRPSRQAPMRSVNTAKAHHLMRPYEGVRRQGQDRLRGGDAPAAIIGAGVSIGLLTSGTFAHLEGHSNSEPSEYAEFVRWLRGHGIPVGAGGQEADLRISNHHDGRGTSVELNPSELRGGDTIAKIPKDAIVDIHAISNGGPRYFRRWLQRALSDEAQSHLLTERRIMMLYFLCESDSSPYLRTFPHIGNGHTDSRSRTPLPPLFWPSHERMRLLRGTEIMRPLLAKEKSIRDEWNGMGGPMRRWFHDLQRLNGTPNVAQKSALPKDKGSDLSARQRDDEALFRSFCWADSLFWTRVLQYTSRSRPNDAIGSKFGAASYHWVPLVDSCNHSPAPSCYWSLDEDGNVSLIYTPRKNEEERGEVVELQYSYGEQSNAELLFSHGFAVENNPFDAVAWSLLEKDCIFGRNSKSRLSEEKMRFLRQIGLYPQLRLHRQRQELDFGPDILGHFDLGSIYVLFLLVLKPEEFVLSDNNNAGDRSAAFAVRCCVSGVKDSKVKVSDFDDFEDFCDEQCDALMPRVLELLGNLFGERKRAIKEDTCLSSVHPNPKNARERSVVFFLLGQMRLIDEAQDVLGRRAKTDLNLTTI